MSRHPSIRVVALAALGIVVVLTFGARANSPTGLSDNSQQAQSSEHARQAADAAATGRNSNFVTA